MCLPIFKGKLEDWQCTSFQILVWIVLWGINNIYCHIWALVWAVGLSFLPTSPPLSLFLFDHYLYLCLYRPIFPFRWLPSGPHIKADAHRELSPTLSMSVTQINAQSITQNIPASLECFRNPYKFMTQFQRRRGNQPCRSCHPADPRLQLAAMLDGLSIWFIGAEYAH